MPHKSHPLTLYFHPQNPIFIAYMTARSLLPVTVLLLMCLGCETGQPASSPMAVSQQESPAASQFTVPFRKDGSLDFIRGGEAYLTIDIEIADSDSTIERGLMQRTSMPELGGMIFLMAREELQNFWMSNTQISLDILFAKGDGEIVSIEKYTTPLSPESVPSRFPALYVVEVAAGFIDTHGIIEGDRIEWRRDE
jgi:uncharacterized membrane protein (UPF0127 family)